MTHTAPAPSTARHAAEQPVATRDERSKPNRRPSATRALLAVLATAAALTAVAPVAAGTASATPTAAASVAAPTPTPPGQPARVLGDPRRELCQELAMAIEVQRRAAWAAAAAHGAVDQAFRRLNWDLAHHANLYVINTDLVQIDRAKKTDSAARAGLRTANIRLAAAEQAVQRAGVRCGVPFHP